MDRKGLSLNPKSDKAENVSDLSQMERAVQSLFPMIRPPV